jgi:hypothetical protein
MLQTAGRDAAYALLILVRLLKRDADDPIRKRRSRMRRATRRSLFVAESCRIGESNGEINAARN